MVNYFEFCRKGEGEYIVVNFLGDYFFFFVFKIFGK